MKLRIATYNIHKGVSSFGRHSRIHGIKNAVSLLDADLIFLQEVQGRHDLHARTHDQWPEDGQHDFLAGESHEAAYGMNAVYDHGHHGNALLSRFPITRVNNYDVSDHAYEQRGILHAVVSINGTEVHCFVIHLGLFAVSRRRQIAKLVMQIKRDLPDNAPLIIAGDFNDWTQRLSRVMYQELAVSEVFDQRVSKASKLASTAFGRRSNFILSKVQWPRWQSHAKTFPAALPWLSLDRVYQRGFQIHEALVLRGAPWDTLSDHVPIVASLSLRS